MAEARQEFPIEQQIRQDMKEAQRSRDQLKLDTLRMALGAIHNLEVARTDRKNAEYGQPLTEADCIKMLEQELTTNPMTQIVFSMDSPGMDPRHMRSSLELFAKEIMPHFRNR